MGSYRSSMLYRYFKLPNTLYDVRVPRIATMTDAEIEFLGLPITVVDGHLEVKERDFVTVMLNLNRILDIFIDGYPIYLVNPNDLKSMYESYTNYINNFRTDDNVRLNRVELIENPERLKELERLLNTLFDKYKVNIYKDSLDPLNCFGKNGFMSIGPASIKHQIDGVIMPTTEDLNNEIRVGHIYDYSSAPNIDLTKLKRSQTYRKATKI